MANRTSKTMKRAKRPGAKTQGKPGTAVKTRAALMAAKVQHLYQYGTLGIYENDGALTIHRLVQGQNRVDLETDIATWKSEVLAKTLMLLINDKQIDRWNSTQQDTYEDLVIYGAQLLIELKNQVIQAEYIPTLTRSDSTRGSTFTRATLTGLLASLAEIRLPTLSYVIAELYTKVIQIRGPQLYQSMPAGYFQPFRPYKTYTEIESLVGTIISKYDAAVYAKQIDTVLKPFSVEWLYTINETTMYSWYGEIITEYLPCKVEDGGVTETNVEIDETTDVDWYEILGIPELMDGLTFFRSHGCASGDAPAAIAVVGLGALADPAANTQSFVYADIGDSSFTAFAKADADMTYLATLCTNIGAGHNGLFSGRMHTQKVNNVLASNSTWDYKCGMWLAKHMIQPIINVELHGVVPDMVVSGKRKSGGQIINYNINIEAAEQASGPGAPAGPIEAAATLVNQAVGNITDLLEDPIAAFTSPVDIGGFNMSFDGIMQDIDLSGFQGFSSFGNYNVGGRTLPSFGFGIGGGGSSSPSFKLPW